MTIVIIEDSKAISHIIERTLQSYGYLTNIFISSQPLKSIINNTPFDLIILSTNLEHCDSQDLCKFIRFKFPSTFIIGINSKGVWKSRTSILNNGADDCMSFPFPTQELLARIQTLLRRPRVPVQMNLKYGNIKLDPSLRKVYYNKKPLTLTKKEYHLLEYMMRNSERTITRSELLDHVWDYKRITGSNTIDVHIQKLRKKMRMVNNLNEINTTHTAVNDSYINPDINFTIETEIQTVHGIGYRLDQNALKRNNRKFNTLDKLRPL